MGLKPLKTEAIKAFLNAKTHPDLASMYNRDMEVQVNVAQDGGERVEGEYEGAKWLGFSDGVDTWKSFRIPRNANTVPEYDDHPITFDVQHIEGIGMTGYDWKNRCSRWVAFDFDAIVGHSEAHQNKLSSEELGRVKDAASNIPWVTVRYSTSGKGLHLYVMLDAASTENHTEHAALARAILAKMSSLTGYDFASKVDVCIPGETWTLTDEGARQIKDLINTPCNLIVNGVKYKTDGFFHTKYDDVYEIETIEGYKVQATSNHPFFVDYDGLRLWQELKDIQIGDKLVLNNHQNVEWCGEGTFAEGYILGWLIGDGFLSVKGLGGDSGKGRSKQGYMRNGLYFHKFDHCMVDFVMNLFETKPNNCYNSETDCYCLYSREIESLRLKFGLDETKEITPEIENASSTFLRGFLSAFFDTDGHAEKTNAIVNLTQSNLPRLQAIQRILMRFGIKSSISLSRKAGKMTIQGRICNTKNKYELDIRRKNILIFNQRIGFKHPDKHERINKNIKRVLDGPKGLLDESFTVRVKSIILKGKENVYDVKVPNINAFDANGFFIHNCGSNMWVWHRKMKGTDGLMIIKQGGVLTDIPPNWKDHLKVVKGVSKKLSAPTDIENLGDVESKFDLLCGKRTRVKLDAEHLRHIKYLNDNGLYHWWDADRHMLVTHTASLKKMHTELGLRGIFETETKATSTHNCFLYPMRRGAWSVRRFSPGCKEHVSWDQDGAGWTRSYYNQDPTLSTASTSNGGIEDPSGGYHFRDGESASNAANVLGANVTLPPKYAHRETTLKPHKDGNRLVIEIPYQSSDNPGELVGWLHKANKWIKIFAASKVANIDVDSEDYDDLLRHLVTEGNEDSGWVINSDGVWHNEPLMHIKPALMSMSIKRSEIDSIIGSSVLKPWTLVKYPFASEYPGDRLWNRNAPQLRYIPSISDTLTYPTWSMILNHIGKSITMAVQKNEWCQRYNIKTGGEYLKLWVASMIQFPKKPLPYLYIYSEKQETGKSSFHEALQMLFHPGYMNIGHALKNQSTFNAELEGAIFGVVEEMNLNDKTNRVAYDRIKEWVTGLQISIHRKGSTPYMIDNTIHIVHLTNHRSYCPAFDGDTRITMINILDKPEKEIPKEQLMKQLDKEAPDFLASILNMEIPEAAGRLRIPIINTEDKIAAAASQRTALEEFIAEQCFLAPGEKVSLAEFFDKFQAWLEPGERANWTTKQSVSKAMPDWVVKGRSVGSSQHCWGNISFKKPEEGMIKKTLVCVDGFLRSEQ